MQLLNSADKKNETTKQLADLISKVKNNGKYKKIIPQQNLSGNSYQNKQRVRKLENVLSEMINKICIGGRFVILTFHSLEDRIVKHFFNSHVKRKDSLQEGGYKINGLQPYIKWISKNVIIPSRDEIEKILG